MIQLCEIINICGSFTSPLEVGVTPWALFWLLPLLAAVVVAYKATKLEKIEAVSFIRECTVLFLSLTVFTILVGFALTAFMWLVMG